MLRYLSLLLFSLLLFAGHPKIYSSIGNPLYNAIGPTKKLSTFVVFKDHRREFENFVKWAGDAKREGFWLDSHKGAPDFDARSKRYLKRLRNLQQYNSMISHYIKDETLTAIKKHHVRTFNTLTASAHPVFKRDKELAKACKRFKRQLKRERERAHKAKAKREAAYVRSYKNLKGRWKGTYESGEHTTFYFRNTHDIVITRTLKNRTQTLKGRWKIGHTVLNVSLTSITNKRQGEVAHTRASKANIVFDIKRIGRKRLVLFDRRNRQKLSLAR